VYRQSYFWCSGNFHKLRPIHLFVLTLSFPVPFCVAPNDYTANSTPQPLTFSSAPDMMCISIIIIDDRVEEPTESFAVTLNSTDPAVNFSIPNANVTIIDGNVTSKYTPSVHSVGKHRISLGVLVSVRSCNACMHSWTQL